MLLGILGACGNKKTNIDPFASITKEVDSIRRVADSIHCDESPEDPQPIQADESFDDFIYNFASDDVLQRQRVKFPLPYYNGDKKTNIEEHNWKHDDLFTKQHYYTPRMKKLSFAQGKLLIKLIDRQSNSTSYELVKAFMGPFKAGFYQTFAALFGASLKKEYDPQGEDKLTERVVLMVENGQI